MGSRLAGDDHFEDGLQEPSCDYYESSFSQQSLGDQAAGICGTETELRQTNKILTVIQADERTEIIHENQAEAPQPSGSHTFYQNENLTDLNPINSMINPEMPLEAAIEALIYKSSFVNPHTGRNNQVLICKQCNHST